MRLIGEEKVFAGVGSLPDAGEQEEGAADVIGGADGQGS